MRCFGVGHGLQYLFSSVPIDEQPHLAAERCVHSFTFGRSDTGEADLTRFAERAERIDENGCTDRIALGSRISI